jgi:hypothetical protein
VTLLLLVVLLPILFCLVALYLVLRMAVLMIRLAFVPLALRRR